MHFLIESIQELIYFNQDFHEKPCHRHRKVKCKILYVCICTKTRITALKP